MILPGFDEGSLFLSDDRDHHFRLYWGEQKPNDSTASAVTKTDERLRALPAGKYTLTEYRIVRRDSQGRRWFIAANSVKGIRQLVVHAGQKQRVELSDVIHMQCSTRPGKMGVMIGAAILGEGRSGLSIYREDRRIPMHYVVRNGQGEILAAGPMRYG